MFKRGQSLIEYACLMSIFVAAIVLMSVYFKRGVQGSWHNNAAGLFPETYDPGNTVETAPLEIRLSDYNFVMSEEGKGGYTLKGADWIEGAAPSGESKWHILSRP